jgi:hypothetical protein
MSEAIKHLQIQAQRVAAREPRAVATDGVSFVVEVSTRSVVTVVFTPEELEGMDEEDLRSSVGENLRDLFENFRHSELVDRARLIEVQAGNLRESDSVLLLGMESPREVDDYESGLWAIRMCEFAHIGVLQEQDDDVNRGRRDWTSSDDLGELQGSERTFVTKEEAAQDAIDTLFPRSGTDQGYHAWVQSEIEQMHASERPSTSL